MDSANNTTTEAPLCPDCGGAGGLRVDDEQGGHDEHCSVCRGLGVLRCETITGIKRDGRGNYLFTTFCDRPGEVLTYDTGPESEPLVHCRHCADLTPSEGWEVTVTARPDGMLEAVWRPVVAPACTEAA